MAGYKDNGMTTMAGTKTDNGPLQRQRNFQQKAAIQTHKGMTTMEVLKNKSFKK